MNSIIKGAVISFSLFMFVLLSGYAVILPAYGAAAVARDLSNATNILQNLLNHTNSTSSNGTSANNGTSPR